MKRIFTLLFLSLLVSVQLFAQDRTVTGTVVDEGNEPLPGVSVVVKGTNAGTATDFDGKYSIKVPSGSNVLVYSFLGMKTKEETLGSSNSVNVTLAEDIVGLDEVVVTAIGIQREKREIGYSVQEVKGDALTQSRETNVVQALSGKVAGVQVTKSAGVPGGSSYIKIRGNSSITGGNQPLFILDGIPIDNSSDYSGNPDDGSNNLLQGVNYSNRAIDLNSNDIESVNVLKGPAATALYGLRAANGAIIITTKKGSHGTKGLNVNFASSVSIDRVGKLPEQNTRYAQGSYVFTSGDPNNPVYLGPETGWFGSWGPALDTMFYDGATDYPYDVNGNLVNGSDPSADLSMPANVYPNTDDFFQTGTTFDNFVSISGGGDVTSYYLSMGHVRSNGIVPNSQFDRTTVKLTADNKITNKFSVGTSITYSNSGGDRIQQGSNTSGLMLGLMRTPPSFDNSNGLEDPVDGELSPDDDGFYPNGINAYEFADGSQRNYRGGGGYDNPFWTANNAPFKDNVNRVMGYVSADYQPLNWLTFVYRIGMDVYSDRRTQGFEIGSRTLTGGQVYNDEHFNRDFNSDFLVTLQHDLTNDINGRLTLGQNIFSTRHRQVYVQGDGLSIPGFFDVSNAASVLSKEILQRKKTAAIYFDASISWRNIVYLNLTGRNEWSTSLPDPTGSSFFYPAVSLGIEFTEALGLTDNEWFPYGKFRASYAQVGNDAPVYATSNLYEKSNFGDGWTNGVFFPFAGVNSFSEFNTLGNVNLTPETTNAWEIGTDLRFLKNRLGIDFTYYDSRGKDLIVQTRISTATGYIASVLNAGEVSNKGIELTLNARPVQVSGFSWDILMNFTRNKNMVEKLAENVENVFLNGFTGTSTRAVEGYPYGAIFGGAWLRVNDGAGTGYDPDLPYNPEGALIIDDDEASGNYGFPFYAGDEVLGDPNPDWLMGLTNTFSYKGLFLEGLLDIKKGGDQWNGTVGAMNFFGMTKETEELRNTTTVYEGVKASDGSPNDIVATLDENWYVNGNGSGFGAVAEDYVQDAGWVRLRELTLGYTLPKSVIEKTPFQNIDIAFTGTNLWLSTDYTGIDPETNLTGASNGFGLDYFNMPNTKTYTVSLRVGL